MVKPDAFKHLGKIINAISQSGFRIKYVSQLNSFSIMSRVTHICCRILALISQHYQILICLPSLWYPTACSNLRVCQLKKEEAESFYAVHRGQPFFDKLTTFMSSGRIAAIELVAPSAISKWRELIGPTDSNKARAESPNSIRAHFGSDGWEHDRIQAVWILFL
jgi:nucleoside diphosphate kinase